MLTNQANNRPVVGLLYNPAVPYIVDQAGELIEYLAVIPERYWFDFGVDATGSRFRKLHDEIETLRQCARGRTVTGHGIGLSLPSAMPLDEPLIDQIAAFSADLGFSWYSEHLSMFLTPHGNVPNAQAALGLPVVYDEETIEVLRPKLNRLQTALGCKLILANGSIFTSIPEMEMTEPEFLNRLHREIDCGVLLDLHNLYVTWRNGNVDPLEYLEDLDPGAVVEIHMAGGDELAGFYTDSHSRFAPDEIWSWASEFIPRFKCLRAITFEFHESYFERLGLDGIIKEVERLHQLAAMSGSAAEVTYA